jgi:hypothetical protein
MITVLLTEAEIKDLSTLMHLAILNPNGGGMNCAKAAVDLCAKLASCLETAKLAEIEASIKEGTPPSNVVEMQAVR